MEIGDTVLYWSKLEKKHRIYKVVVCLPMGMVRVKSFEYSQSICLLREWLHVVKTGLFDGL